MLLLPPAALLAQAAPAPAASALRDVTPAEAAALDKAFGQVVNKIKAPLMLRLAFHDAGTYRAATNDGGPNASVQFELERPENGGLKRGWRFLLDAADKLKGTAAEGLSKADLIQLVGAHSVRVTGGPAISVPVGRIDAVDPDPVGRLPMETYSVGQLKGTFDEIGFSPREMVVLSGSHTIGNKGFGDPSTFDTTYFSALLRRPWENKADSMASMIGLPSDHVLPDDAECLSAIKAYAADRALFFNDFSEAYAKLGALGQA